MRIGGREFPSGVRTYVMGILNVTPDSFSDGGEYNSVSDAMKAVERMIKEGADLIDVGGESTRPGHIQIHEEEEIQRIVPVIEEIKKQFDIPVSVDTYKSTVAAEAIAAGADLLNDIWGFRYDEGMSVLAAEKDIPVCLMHNREKAEYTDYLQEVIEDLQISLAIAKKHGVKEENIILDPGVGFGKTYEQNLMIMNHLEDIVALGYPVLLGASRKSMIGLTLDLPVTEREEGTIATSVIGAIKGCEYVRVHDVEKNVRALKMADAILHRAD
ncbi:MAG: dihydropteroate synthase [Lachnospiraceae bacterium]|nr:dihydropteroate synthase [Lachnospiraceae bacterium]